MANDELVYATLQIANYDTVIDFAQHPNIRLTDTGYAPERPNRVDTLLGRHGEYADVAVELRFYASTTSGDPADVVALITAVSNLLEQADGWGRRNGEEQVTYRVLLQGSTLDTPLEAVVAGPDGTRDMMQLPTNFIQRLGTANDVGPIVIRFKRRGQLLGSADISSAGVAQAALNPITVQMADEVSVGSPTAVSLDLRKNGTSPSGLTHNDGYIVVSDFAQPLIIQPATNDSDDNSMILVQGATQVDDSANNAHMSQVYRFDSDTLNGSSIDGVLRGHPLDTTVAVETVVPLVSVRNNSTFDWAIRAVSRLTTSTSESGVATPWLRIPQDGNVQVVNLGPLARAAGNHQYIFIEVRTLSANTGLDDRTLDVNTMLVVPITQGTQVIRIDAQSHVGREIRTIEIDHRVLTHRSPIIYATNDEGQQALMSWRGYPFCSTSGGDVRVWLSLPSGAKWVADHPQEGGAITYLPTVTRHRAYLLPI